MGTNTELESLFRISGNADAFFTSPGMDAEKKVSVYNSVIDKYTQDLTKSEGIAHMIESGFWTKKPELDLPSLNDLFENRPPTKFSKKVQKWKGIVQEISQNSFTAKLFDLTQPSEILEIAELEADDVSPEDKEMLKIGSIFYWTVGYFMDNGQISKKSVLRFQRLITLNDEDMEEILSSVDMKFKTLKDRNANYYPS